MTAAGGTRAVGRRRRRRPASSACCAVAWASKREADRAAIGSVERLPAAGTMTSCASAGPSACSSRSLRLGDGQAADVDAGTVHAGADARLRRDLRGRRRAPRAPRSGGRGEDARAVASGVGYPAACKRAHRRRAVRRTAWRRAAPRYRRSRCSAADDDAGCRELPPGLWDRLRLDPVRAPEHIALAAGAHVRAAGRASWAADKRARFAVAPAELAQMAKKRHATLARFEGAATGVGGFVTMVPDLVALAWIQSRLVFYIAAAYGYDPHDPMRPAELLVLHDFYSDPRDRAPGARRDRQDLVEAYVGSKLQREEALALRLAKMVGVRSARKLAGRLIPGVAIAVQRDRQRAPHARAGRQGDPLLRRLSRALAGRRPGSRRRGRAPTPRCRGSGSRARSRPAASASPCSSGGIDARLARRVDHLRQHRVAADRRRRACSRATTSRERDHARPWTRSSRPRPRTDAAPSARRRSTIAPPPAAASAGSAAWRDEIGRAQVERELGLEVGDRRVGDGLAGREAADEVDDGAQRRAAVGRRDARRARRDVGRRRSGRPARPRRPRSSRRAHVEHDDAPAAVGERARPPRARARRCRR